MSTTSKVNSALATIESQTTNNVGLSSTLANNNQTPFVSTTSMISLLKTTLSIDNTVESITDGLLFIWF